MNLRLFPSAKWRLVVALLSGSLIGGLLTAPVAASPVPSVRDFRDPTTIPNPSAGSNSYLTFGSSITDQTLCGVSSPGARIRIPVLSHFGDGLAASCYTADALPVSVGPIFADTQDLWAPTVIQIGSTWTMYFSARKATGQYCVAKAISTSAAGPYGSVSEFACPAGGRWAIDPYAFQSGGSTYVAYRDDATASGVNSGISVVRVGGNGLADWATRRTLLLSTDISWGLISATGANIVENPAIIYRNGRFFLFFSGNDWASAKYATGLADCGTSITGTSSRCTPVGSASVPYFGYVGPLGWGTTSGTMSPNLVGSGGLDIFSGIDGTTRAVWHALTGSGFDRRKSLIGSLTFNAPNTFSLNGTVSESRPDIVSWEPGSGGRFVVGVNQGNSSFDWNIRLTGIQPPAPGAVADFTGDGKADIVSWEPGGGGRFVLWQGGNGGTLSWGGVWLSGIQQPGWFGAGDFNGDSRPDIVSWEPGSGGRFVVGVNQGNSSFDWNIRLTGIQPPAPGAVADFTGDGKADIVSWEPGGGGRFVLWQGGNGGTLSWGGVWLSGIQQPGWFGAGDFNGDSRPDIVSWEPGSGGRFVVGVNQGNSSFDWNIRLTGIQPPAPGAVADFTGDGKADIVSWEPGGGGRFVLWQGGNGGTLSWGGVWLSGIQQPGWFGAGDFNGA